MNGNIPTGNRDKRRKEISSQISTLFDYIVDHEIKPSMEPETKSWANSLTLDWIAHESINALAKPEASVCRIALFTGLTGAMWDGYLALAAHPSYLTNLPGGMELGPKETFRWLNIIPQIMRGCVDDADRDTLHKFGQIPSKRIEYVSKLYQFAIRFLILHEIYHFWCGHLYYSRELYATGLTANPSGTKPPIDTGLHRAFEFHADAMAIKEIIAVYSSLDDNREQFLNDWCTALGILFLFFEPFPKTHRGWQSKAYPHPHLRFFNILHRIYDSMGTSFGFSSDQVDAFFQSSFAELALINVSSRRFSKIPLDPLEAVKKNGATYMADLDTCDKRMKAELSRLQSAQKEMWAHFSKAPQL